MDDRLATLTRKRERAAARTVLDEVFDQCLVATVSTVLNGEPWVVPMLVVRDHDRLLLHGSSGAGALRHIADGAPVVVSAFVLDGLVVAERQFDHSANYRSAVVRGTCSVVGEREAADALSSFTDHLLPGRSTECPPHTGREIAATVVLELFVTEDNWIAKHRSGPPSSTSDERWTGVVPTARMFEAPVSDSKHPVPDSVRRVTHMTDG